MSDWIAVIAIVFAIGCSRVDHGQTVDQVGGASAYQVTMVAAEVSDTARDQALMIINEEIDGLLVGLSDLVDRQQSVVIEQALQDDRASAMQQSEIMRGLVRHRVEQARSRIQWRINSEVRAE